MESNKIKPQEIAELKQKFGILYIVGFNAKEMGNGDNKSLNPNYDPDYPTMDFVFKRMDFDLFAATTATAVDKPIQSIKTQMVATLVWGKKEYLDDPVVFSSLMVNFSQINRARSSELKKI